MNKAKAFFAYSWVTFVIFALATFLVTVDAPGIVHAAAIGMAVIFVRFCVRVVEMEDGVEKAAVISFFGRPYRPVGSGLVLLFQPLGIPIERIAKTILLRECVIDDKMTAETKSKREGGKEEVVPVDFSIEYRPFINGLLAHLRFAKDQVDSAIKQRVKSLLSIRVHDRKDRQEVYHDLVAIAAEVQEEFNRQHGEQYGVAIRFMIDDPELPPDIAEAERKREIQELENERRAIEMRKLKTMANQLVREAEKKGQKLSLEQALKLIQVQLGIIKESRSTYGLDPGTLEAVKGALPMILSRPTGP